MNITWPSGIGAILALLGLIIVIPLMVGGQMPFLWLGILFCIAFLSRLL